MNHFKGKLNHSHYIFKAALGCLNRIVKKNYNYLSSNEMNVMKICWLGGRRNIAYNFTIDAPSCMCKVLRLDYCISSIFV